MLNEYPRVLGREVPKAHDAMEYLLKLVYECKVQIKGKLEKSVAYHPPNIHSLEVNIIACLWC
jgi:glycerol-3-phosphate dehydrogenase subunit C